nr:MAG TPA: hypothetical protein [Caudoviricetes sp.]
MQNIMNKIELTKEQIAKIAEGISAICFRRDPKNPDGYVLLEYPRVDVFHQSCIWKDPSFDYDHQKEVKQTFLSFEAEHTFGAKELFKPSLAEVIQAMPLDLVGKANAFTIKYDGFNADYTRHVSVVTPYLIGKKIVQIPPVKDKEEEKRLHPSSFKVGDLVGTILDEYCQVSIDWVDPDGNIHFAWQGYLNDVPEEYLDMPFRPINVMTDFERRIHLIVN